MMKRLSTRLTQALSSQDGASVSRSTRQRGGRRIPLLLECLEDRTAPALLTVTSAADTPQAGLLTLRQAVAQANLDAASGQSDTITFDPGLGAAVTLTAGPLELSGAGAAASETIDGGGRITLSGNNASRVVTVDTGVTAVLTGLTITNGNATNNSGGGVYNEGVLTIRDSSVSGNLAADGGGVYNDGSLTIRDSTLAGNSAQYAGGIENYGTLTLDDSTLTGNRAGSFGGGLWTTGFAPAAVTLTNVTLTANRANTNGLGGQGGGLWVDPGSTAAPLLHNTLIAGNYSGPSRDDVLGPVASAGDYNLIGDGTGMTGISDGVHGNQVGSGASPIDPRLGSPGYYGGPTQTVPLLSGSPALAAGSTAYAATDQRGFARVVNGAIDIGAFEVQSAGQATHLVFQVPASIQAGVPFAVTVTALDDFGRQATGYTGTVHFTLTPAGAAANYTFTAADAGQHTFNGLTLTRSGTDTLTGASAASAAISGQVTFTVTPAAADHIVFSEPSVVTAGVPFSITVVVQDAYGNAVTDYIGTVHFVASNGAAADYTFTAADAGQHTFVGLVLRQPGTVTISGTDAADPAVTGMYTIVVM